MAESRIHAVDHVHLEAPPEAREGLCWFYNELIGLTELAAGEGGDGVLRFKSGQLELRIRLSPDARVEPVDERATFFVSSLAEAEAELRERRMTYELLRGFDWTDRRISVLDPAGNRVCLRRDPSGMPL